MLIVEGGSRGQDVPRCRDPPRRTPFCRGTRRSSCTQQGAAPAAGNASTTAGRAAAHTPAAATEGSAAETAGCPATQPAAADTAAAAPAAG